MSELTEIASRPTLERFDACTEDLLRFDPGGMYPLPDGLQLETQDVAHLVFSDTPQDCIESARRALMLTRYLRLERAVSMDETTIEAAVFDTDSVCAGIWVVTRAVREHGGDFTSFETTICVPSLSKPVESKWGHGPWATRRNSLNSTEPTSRSMVGGLKVVGHLNQRMQAIISDHTVQ
jgi:hypothetical protein